ncbi:hypothetical protein [Microbacterium sp. 77mftsu3.1]|uniref:hypothetical protein n=1 Tax=Microbacterium sp. 77mftsu3.1 TaxID=1761802 RepID=UPI00039DE28B|nr:hypothetical protein [Microbacterium sp. 77mftsu3.1]SDH50380.1 hypothetical protein SAMN04488590_3466 [Microbacterium sp. 77mftsu3.1]
MTHMDDTETTEQAIARLHVEGYGKRRICGELSIRAIEVIPVVREHHRVHGRECCRNRA